MEIETRRLEAEEDAVVADLVERLERQAAELAHVRDELDQTLAGREKLETELAIARRWVQVLAREVELADLQLKEARPLRSRIEARTGLD